MLILNLIGRMVATGNSGTEVRNSFMVNYDDGKTGFSLGTNFWGGMKGADGENLNQQTGILKFRSGDFGFYYENDGSPFYHENKSTGKTYGLSGGTDKYRTAALGMNVGDFSAGVNLFTGNRDLKKDTNYSYVDEYGMRHRHGAAFEVGSQYRMGALYLSYKGFRAGVNSEHVRHAIQNVLAHHLISPQGSFQNTSWDWRPYSQYQTSNPFTSW